MTKIIAWLEGKKTYIVALITILYAIVVVGVYQHNWSEVMPFILGSSAIATLRSALSTKLSSVQPTTASNSTEIK